VPILSSQEKNIIKRALLSTYERYPIIKLSKDNGLTYSSFIVLATSPTEFQSLVIKGGVTYAITYNYTSSSKPTVKALGTSLTYMHYICIYDNEGENKNLITC
jgi:hypothetical protein